VNRAHQGSAAGSNIEQTNRREGSGPVGQRGRGTPIDREPVGVRRSSLKGEWASGGGGQRIGDGKVVSKLTTHLMDARIIARVSSLLGMHGTTRSLGTAPVPSPPLLIHCPVFTRSEAAERLYTPARGAVFGPPRSLRIRLLKPSTILPEVLTRAARLVVRTQPPPTWPPGFSSGVSGPKYRHPSTRHRSTCTT
jgi:hypothetical protein